MSIRAQCGNICDPGQVFSLQTPRHLSVLPLMILALCSPGHQLKFSQEKTLIICGKNYESYSDTLSELGMQRLSERRNILCLKFAKKSLKIDNFGHLFPLNSKFHDMKTRNSDYYKVSKSYSKRYLQSAIPSMQRLLNRDKREQKESLRKILDCSVTSKLCLV